MSTTILVGEPPPRPSHAVVDGSSSAVRAADANSEPVAKEIFNTNSPYTR